MQSSPSHVTSLDGGGQYNNYHGIRHHQQCQNQQHQHHQHQHQHQHQPYPHQETPVAKHHQRHVTAPSRRAASQTTTSSQQQPQQPLAELSPAASQGRKIYTIHQAAHQQHHRPQQYYYIQPRNVYVHQNPPRPAQQQKEQQQQQQKHHHHHKHNKNHHPNCICQLVANQPIRASTGRSRVPTAKEASLQNWLSDFEFVAGELKGSDLEGPEYVFNMDVPVAATHASPRSMALSPSPMSQNADEPGVETPPEIMAMHTPHDVEVEELKREVDENGGAALWGALPVDMQMQYGGACLPLTRMPMQVQMQSSYSQVLYPPISSTQGSTPEQHLAAIVSTLPGGVYLSSSGYQPMQFAAQHQQQQQQQQLATSWPAEHVLDDSMTRAQSSFEAQSFESQSTPTTAANTSFSSTSDSSTSSYSLCDMPLAAPTPAPAPAPAPMQHSLSTQSAASSSATSFMSLSALHPLYAPSLLPAAFYEAPPPPPRTTEAPLPDYGVMGDLPLLPAATQKQQAGTKRSAPSPEDEPSPKQQRRTSMAGTYAHQVDGPAYNGSGSGSNSADADTGFDFGDYIDLSTPRDTVEASFPAENDFCNSNSNIHVMPQHGLPVSGEESIMGRLDRSWTTTDAATAAATASMMTMTAGVSPAPPNARNDGTVSPRDLCVDPQISESSGMPSVARVAAREASYFSEYDPVMVGGGQVAGGQVVTEAEAAAAAAAYTTSIDDVYPYGPSVCSPRMPPHWRSLADAQVSPSQGSSCHHHQQTRRVDVRDLMVQHGTTTPDYIQQQQQQQRPSPHASSSSPRPERVSKNSTTPATPATPDDHQRLSDADRHRKDQLLLQLKRDGYTYREIRTKGGFTEAESTLRGRFRMLTKAKQERVRKPTWTLNDDRLLIRAVNAMARGRAIGHFKVPWKAVADWIVDQGGSYHFGNTTCRKRFDWLLAQGMVGTKSPASVVGAAGHDGADDDVDEEDDDDEPSTVYFGDDQYEDRG